MDLKGIKELLQLFGIVPKDDQAQLFQEIFDPEIIEQFTVLPNKKDVTQVLCLGSVAKLLEPYDLDGFVSFLYQSKLDLMRSYKGTNLGIFKDIFQNNPPNEMTVSSNLPSPIPSEPKKGFFARLRGDKE